MLCTLYKPLSKSTNDIEPTLSEIITCYVCRPNSKYMLQLSLILLDKYLQIYCKKKPSLLSFFYLSVLYLKKKR